MKNEILFEEKQKFRQGWFWLLLLGINMIFLLGLYKQVVGGQQFGDRPVSNEGLLLITGASILLSVLFSSVRLETQIKKDGIYVRFFPFHLSFKHFSWDKISKAFVIVEYSSWRLRFGLLGSGRAYNVSGNNGLQLEFSNHKKLLIGTSKPDELTAILIKIGQLKN